MAVDPADGEGDFLRRWSRRKLAATREALNERPHAASVPPTPDAPAPAPAVAPTVALAAGAATAPAPDSAAGPGAVRDDAQTLPAVDTLSFDSDFARYLSPKVDETLKRQALRKLFSDPHFNVMDGLDVYIDDYSKFEPIPADLVGKLRHARYIFDPPKTRVNEAGHVEDVPDEPPEGPALAAGAAPEGAEGEPPATVSDAGREVEGVPPELPVPSAVESRQGAPASNAAETGEKR